MSEIRLNKFLAVSGYCSRRKADIYIEKGLVKVNGKVVSEMGVKIDDEKDKVQVDEQIQKDIEDRVYYAMNKPQGYITSCEKRNNAEKIVMDLIDVKERVYPIGRLDKDSEGLLLFSNDGVFAYKMTHPKFEHEKEYLVTVSGNITKGSISKLEAGVKLWGEKTRPTIIRKCDKNKFFIVLTEGKNRQIRRICKKVGFPVTRLVRVRIGGFKMDSLEKGAFRKLSKNEVKMLSK